MLVEHGFAILSRPCKRTGRAVAAGMLEMVRISDLIFEISAQLKAQFFKFRIHLKSSGLSQLQERKVRTLQGSEPANGGEPVG